MVGIGVRAGLLTCADASPRAGYWSDSLSAFLGGITKSKHRWPLSRSALSGPLGAIRVGATALRSCANAMTLGGWPGPREPGCPKIAVPTPGRARRCTSGRVPHRSPSWSRVIGLSPMGDLSSPGVWRRRVSRLVPLLDPEPRGSPASVLDSETAVIELLGRRAVMLRHAPRRAAVPSGGPRVGR